MVVQHNWWCPPEEYQDTQDDWFLHFFQDACSQFHEADADKIHVYSVFGHQTFPQDEQMRNDVNFLFIGENTTVNQDHPLYYTMDSVLTFFHDSPKSIRLPLWMIYWNFYKDGLFPTPPPLPLDPNNPPPPPRLERAIIVISHDNNEIRRQICSKVLHDFHIPIDSNFEHVPHSTFIEIPRRGTCHKRSLLQHYQYNICAENSFNRGYVTEKIFEAFCCGCVPIYWGHTPVEPDILHQDSFLNVFEDLPSKTLTCVKNIWKDDAVVHIFATYLKVWSIAYRKLGLRTLRNRVPLCIYIVHDKSECGDLLKDHWKRYQTLWNPRPHFRVMSSVHLDSEEVMEEVLMEDLADEMYTRFQTSSS